MTDEFADIKKMDKSIKEQRIEDEPKVKQKYKTSEELWKEGQMMKKEEARKRKEQKIEELRKKRQTLLQKKKEQLELEKTKADIRKLRQETGFFGKTKRELQRAKKGFPKTKATETKKPRQRTKVKSKDVVIIDGQAYVKLGGTISTSPKPRKKKKKKEEFWL